MSTSGNLFPGFSTRYIATSAGRIFTRIGGNGPPLVLLHGFPETGVMWHRIAPRLAHSYTVVIPDLRGYGWSSAPRSENGDAYTKRAMGADVTAIMDELGHVRFALAGHDRGARVGYRLALDHPGRITKLVLLDILPTSEVWRLIEAGTGTSPHWAFLAEPAPKPETEIGKAPDDYYFGLMRLWAKDNTLNAFDPRALAEYKSGWGDPSRVHAVCEDYRAGTNQDRQADDADAAAGRTIQSPVHVIAGSAYLARSGDPSPLELWRKTFAPHATGTEIDAGHFVAEENAPATLQAVEAFLAS